MAACSKSRNHIKRHYPIGKIVNYLNTIIYTH